MSQRYLIWDFDGTLAELPGMWSGTLAEVVRRHGDCASATATDFRPFLQSGFPWHAPEILRTSERNADAWWGDLSPLLVNALVRGAPIGARRASELLPAVHHFGGHRHPPDDIAPERAGEHESEAALGSGVHASASRAPKPRSPERGMIFRRS